MNNCKLFIKDLDCPDCAAKIVRDIKSLPEIEDARIDFLSKSLSVTGKSIPLNLVFRKIRAHGFSSIQQTDDISEIKRESANPHTRRIVELSIGGSATLLGGLALWLEFPDTIALPLLIAGMIIAGYPVIRQGIYSIINLNLDITFLMTLAAAGGLIIGEWTEASVIIVLFALSELLESMSIDKSRKAVSKLMKRSPARALIMRGSSLVEIPVSQIKPGDLVIVKPGMTVPVDGEVLSGITTLDQSAVTGESMPRRCEPGDSVPAGSINQEGAIQVRAINAFENSTLAQIERLLTKAQEEKPRVQSFIERFAIYYTPSVVAISALIAVLPPLVFAASWETWIYRALAMLIISCPCALVISTPVTIVSALASASSRGVLIKGGVYLEQLFKTKIIAFDKTGTLTNGRLSLKEVHTFNGSSRDEIIHAAASIEYLSQHPIASVIINEAKKLNLNVKMTEGFTSYSGRGASAQFQGEKTFVGNHALFEELGICSESIHASLESIESAAQTAVIVGTEKKIMGIIAITDEIRKEAFYLISSLKENGIQTAVLTGDNHRTANAISHELGLDLTFSELLPVDKVNIVRNLREKYGNIAMVGDGINDAAALTTANTGIAVGESGTDIALESADVVLMGDRLDRLPWLLRLSRKSHGIIVTNIAFALGIKLLFLLLAATGNATLWMAVFADMGLTMLVIMNGMRALRNK